MLSTPFQNRLVGTIIVAAVAVIFLPDILDGEKQSLTADFENIPPVPKAKINAPKQSFPQEKVALHTTEKKALSDEKALDDIENNHLDKGEIKTGDVSQLDNTDQSNTDQNITDQRNDIKTAKIEQPKLATVIVDKTLPEKSIPKQAWVVQLGSFRHKKNVDELVDKLKKNKYTAFTQPIETKSGLLTKVFVGPELTKSSLTKKLKNLENLTGVRGKVARFYPTKQ